MSTLRNRPLALIAALALLAVVSACGGGSSTPTSPTSATPTKIIGLSGSLAFGDVTVGSSKDLTLTITNTGTATLTFTGITASGGLTAHATASPTTGSIPPGGNVTVLFRFTPASAGSFSGTVTVTADQTSGTNTIAMSGTGVAAPTPPITVVGVVTDSNTRRAVGGVTVSAIKNDATAQSFALTTTDGNGFYSIVVPSGISVSVSFTKSGYNFQSSATTFTSDARRDISLAPFWTMTGTGNTVFSMPTNVSRVRIIGTYTGNSSNFIVKIAGRLIVNEVIGTGWPSTTTSGLYLTSGGTVEITNSSGVAWSFAQEQ